MILLWAALAFTLPPQGEDALKLSHEQRVALRDLRDEARAQQQKIRADIDLAEIELRRELEKESPDEKRVAAVVDKMSGFEAQARKTQILAWLKMRALLSKDQRKKLESMRGTEVEGVEGVVDPFESSRESSRDAMQRALAELRRERPRLERDTEKMLREAERMRKDAGGLGSLTVNAMPAARVLVDGREVGMTPLRKVTLAPGRHRVKLVAGDREMESTIEIRPGEETRLLKKFDVK